MDFERFRIGQPNEDGDCSDDRFSVINTEGKVPVICGDNDDHHSILSYSMNLKQFFLNCEKLVVYLKTSSAERVQLRFNFGKPSVPPGTRKWKIKITLLPCCASDLGILKYIHKHFQLRIIFDFKFCSSNRLFTIF